MRKIKYIANHNTLLNYKYYLKFVFSKMFVFKWTLSQSTTNDIYILKRSPCNYYKINIWGYIVRVRTLLMTWRLCVGLSKEARNLEAKRGSRVPAPATSRWTRRSTRTTTAGDRQSSANPTRSLVVNPNKPGNVRYTRI